MKTKIRIMIKQLIRWLPFLADIVAILHPGYQKYKISSLYEYANETGRIRNVINSDNFHSIRRPAKTVEEYECWNQDEFLKVKLSRQYVALLEGAKVLSRNDGIVVGDFWLNDRIEWDRAGIDIYLPDGVLYMNQDVVYQKAKVTNTIEKGIFLLKEFTPNFFHFTLESICRLKWIDELGGYDEWPLLLDSNGKGDIRTLQLLEVVNDRNHPIIWLDHNDVTYVKQLIVPPITTWGARDFSWRNEKKLGIIVDSEAMFSIRNKVLKKYVPKRRYNKVYVERGNNDRLINEDEVKAFLLNNGFEIFNPDKGDFWDEVDCFATAKVIVTVVGGALTNCIYSRPDAIIINLCPYEYQTVAYTFLKDSINLNLKMLSANVTEAGPSINKTKFMLSSEQLTNILLLSSADV